MDRSGLFEEVHIFLSFLVPMGIHPQYALSVIFERKNTTRKCRFLLCCVISACLDMLAAGSSIKALGLP